VLKVKMAIKRQRQGLKNEGFMAKQGFKNTLIDK
jgi:hypothetical protein